MKDILVYVRDHRERTPAARYGAQLAGALGAAMTAVYVCPSPMYVAPAYEPELMAAFLENMHQLVAEAVQSRQAFLDWAASAGATQAEWVVAAGSPVDALAQAASWHDLLVIDHPEETRGVSWNVPAIVLKANVPCVVLPQAGMEFRAIKRAAIGWNGSPEAMRAVHAAMPFLAGREVLLLRGEEREKYPLLEWHPPFDIEAYLRQRGVTVTTRSITAKPDDVGTALLDQVTGFGADLLVMGAYGRSRFSEWMLGGATRDVLAWAHVPVLLRH